MIGDMSRGARYLLQGFRLIRLPGVRRFVLVPALINMILFGGLIVLGGRYFDGWMDTLLPSWLGWLEYVLWPIFAVAVLAVSYYTFTLVANLIGAPFNDRLSARVAAHLGCAPAESNLHWSRAALVSIADELRKWLYFAALALLALVIWVVPVTTLLAPLAWMLLGIWMMALEYADYPMGNDGLTFREKRAWLRNHRGLAIGFGGLTLVATLIPVVNFLVMPAAVAGATALWVERRDMPGNVVKSPATA